MQTYKTQIPSLFVYNAVLIVSDGWDARCGTLTSSFSRFMAWKTEDGVNLAEESALQMETMTNGMLRKYVLLDLIKHFIVYEKCEEKTAKKINLVQSKKFSEHLEDAISRYHNGMIDTVEFLEKVLIPLAKGIKEADRRGEILKLNFRELAFYDALEVNDSAVKILGDEKLQAIARELLQSVRNSATIDWTIKESVQAMLRRNIRRILRKYGYPPDLQEKAVQTVIDQAKLLAEDLVKQI